tara:strand:- start:95 stop:418 length:324 start_codon:yes stop_codon:yes gene_type:complete
MAKGDLTKSIEVDRIEIIGDWVLSIRTTTKVKEEQDDGSFLDISSAHERSSLVPFSSLKLADGSWQHEPTDLSNELPKVKAVAESLWTNDVKESYKKAIEANLFTPG